MNASDYLIDEVSSVNQDLTRLFSRAKSIPGLTDHAFEDWEETCNSISRQLAEGIVRIAVVGTIKSGKSTFVNSLFKGDFLKRGAGVVTSIVTRIRCGQNLQAKLFFKSWDEVNADLQNALILFPSIEWSAENDRLDIRRKQDRMNLQHAVDSLSAEQLISQGSRNVNSVLLASYLKGYGKVKSIVAADNVSRQFGSHHFAEHRDFAGDETLAVYLRDLQLEIDSDSLDGDIEIADCQGSDSSNPLHLAMVQDYLVLTHFIVYVISSRTGLREADIKFLSMIKKMGILENILFILNCDFSEHESIDTLITLSRRVSEEIAMIRPEPEIFVFSALFNLFRAQHEILPEKDRLRLAQWEKESDLVDFSVRESERFENYFQRMLARKRYSLQFRNNLERLAVIASAMNQWIRLNQDILTRGASSANDILKMISHQQERMNQIKSLIKSTLDGARQKTISRLRSDIDRFFDDRSGRVVNLVVGFIRGYNVAFEKYHANLEALGFSSTLYLVFQEFRQALDAYLAESINPELIHFVRQEEERIKEAMASIAEPYDAMVRDAIAEYSTTMADKGILLGPVRPQGVQLQDMEAIKGIIGLKLPPAVTSMRYSNQIKTEAVLRLGFYRIISGFKKLFRKTAKDQNSEAILALKKSVVRMKRETERSILFHFKDYRENIKFQYIFKLVEAVSNSLYDSLFDRFQTYAEDLSKMVELANSNRADKERASEILTEMRQVSEEINQRIELAKAKVD